MTFTQKQIEYLTRLVDNELSYLEDNKYRWKMSQTNNNTGKDVNHIIRYHEESINILEDILKQLKQ